MMLRQALRFGLIGSLATLLHLVTGALLIHSGCSPLLANAVSFLIAFTVGFWGHANYSFADQNSDLTIAIKRFSVVALVGFLLNETLFAILLSQTHLRPVHALILTTGFAALFTFLFSRNWAFRVPTDDQPIKLGRPQ